MDPLRQKLSEMPEKEIAQLYKNLFAGPEGKLVLEHLKTRAYYYQTSFVADPYRSAFAEGQRSLVLDIEVLIDFEPPPEEPAQQEDGENA